MTIEVVKTYATPHKPKGFGVGPFGPIGSLLLAGLAFIVVLLIPAAGIITAVVVGLLGLGVLGLMALKDRHHKSFMDRLGEKWAFRRAKKYGTNTYRPGTLTHIGSHRLPGVLADSSLHVWEDKNGAEFTILEYAKQYVVNIMAEPDGSSLIDPDDLERQVTLWGDWLAALAFESQDLEQAAVTLESSQDTGPTLTLEMQNNQSDRASGLSKVWASQVLKTYPVGSTTIRTYITLTFNAPDPGLDLEGNKIKGQDPVEAIGRLVADRLPHILEDLPSTGAGQVSAMTQDELVEVVRCAYNPEDRVVYDTLASKGQAPPVTPWNAVGPGASDAMWDHYRHSDGASITWEATGFITDEVISKVLMPILEPSADVSMKRVTFLYKPVDPALAAITAEQDHKNAVKRSQSAKSSSAQQDLQQQTANKVRHNTAKGAALINFAILVTATVLDIAKLPAARAVVEHQGPTARLTLRPMYAAQDSGFAQALGPLGLVTSKHLSIPTALSQGV